MHAGLDGHQAIVLWTELTALLLLARIFGAVARRLGQPAIVGNLIAGLVLGPSVFGHVWPAGFGWFLPDGAGEVAPLYAVATLSLVILLITLGAETDLPLIRSLGRAAGWLSASTIVLPLAAGLALAALLPASLLGKAHDRIGFVLIMAGALSVSSLPVVARIISELGLTRRNVGQLSVATATANDAYGFVVLALTVAIAAPGAGSSTLLVALIGLVVLVASLALFGQRVIDRLLREVRRNGPNVAGSLSICMGVALLLAAIAQALGLDAAFGAFLAGVALGRSRFQQSQALEVLDTFTTAVFAPLYFATAGLHVDLGTLARGPVLLAFVLVLVVSTVVKYLSALLGGKLAGVPGRDGSAIGIALNGRGAMQVILGAAGLRLGLLGPGAYTVLILSAIVISVAVPPLLRATVTTRPRSSEEQERLEREEELANNVIVRGQRLLLPTRGSHNSVAAAQVLDLAWPESSEVTLLSIDDGQEPPGAAGRLQRIHELLEGRRVLTENVVSEHVLEAILEEANLGYGVIGLGTVDQPSTERLLPAVVEELLNRSPIPLVVVRRGRKPLARSGHGEVRVGDILVPVTGTSSGRAGQEVAHNISRNSGAPVRLVHVLTRPRTRQPVPAGAAVAPDGEGLVAQGAADAVLLDAVSVADEHGVAAEALLREGASAGEAIAAEVAAADPDLVVLGATVRRVGGRPFLGHTVEFLLEHVTEPTVVVVVQPDAAVNAEEHVDRSAR